MVVWFYAAAMGVLGLATLALAAPGLVTGLVMLTLGFALPLLLIPTIFAYGIALAPAVWAHHRGAAAPLALGLALLCLAALGLGVPSAATTIAQMQARRASAGDVERRLPGLRRIEFVDAAHVWNGRGPILAALPCHAACQTLLLDGEADLVRIVSVMGLDRPQARENGAVSYRFERRAACPAAFARAEDALASTKLAIADGRCIVPDETGAGAAEARVVQFTRWPGRLAGKGATESAAPSSAPLVEPGAERRLEIHDLRGGAPALVYRRTELDWSQIPTPYFHVGWSMTVSSGDGPRLRSQREVFQKIDLPAQLRTALGYRLDIDARKQTPADAGLAARILSEAGEAPFGAEKQAVVSAALDAIARKKGLEADEAALIRTALTDHRLTEAHGLVEALRRHRDVAYAAMGDMIGRLEVPSTNERGHLHAGLAWIVAQAPLDLVRPYRTRIAALLARDAEWGPSALMIPLGRIGGDPTALFVERLAVERGSVAWTAAKAICAADSALAPQVLPVIRATLDRAMSAERNRPNRDIVEIMLRALRRHGSDEEARARLAQIETDPQHAKRLDPARLARDVFPTKERAGVKLCDPSLPE
ncbi:MAG: hypothetical protein IPL88_08965 [Rhizobiales bacterium]|nr:hypothetical protein [Hyphomicrobiales bacterium]